MKNIDYTRKSFGNISAVSVVLACVFFSYLFFSLQYGGPTYLMDEIGYLTKAAAIAGHKIDLAYDYHAGYAFLLAPLFKLLSDPSDIWYGVLAVNAAVWTLTFGVLFLFLRAAFPERATKVTLAVTIASACYPAWIAMSGYAFATTWFVFIYMLSVFVLQQAIRSRPLLIVIYSLLVGFLYWIHPTGLAVVIASFFAVIGYAISSRHVVIVPLHFFITVVMVLSYRYGVDPWLNDITSYTEVLFSQHYDEKIPRLVNNLKNVQFWILCVLLALGHFSYILIASLGVCSYAFFDVWNRFFLAVKADQRRASSGNMDWVFAYLAIATLGMALVGSLSFASNWGIGGIRMDVWFYGRYSEMTLLPLIAVGMMSPWRIRYAILTALFLLVTAFLLSIAQQCYQLDPVYNSLNLQAFWPRSLVGERGDLKYWFLMGAMAVVLVYAVKKRRFLWVALPLYVTSIYAHSSFHFATREAHSTPSGIVQYVRSHFSPSDTTCTGFDPYIGSEVELQTSSVDIFIKERRNLHAYYLYDYGLRGMSPEEWLRDCNGPYLTYRSDQFMRPTSASYIAREEKSGLFLVVRSTESSMVPRGPNPVNLDGAYFDSSDTFCVLAGCYSQSAKQLAMFSQVGRYEREELVTSKSAGYLFYGPYYSLKRGHYQVKLSGDFVNLDGVIIDVTSNSGSVRHAIVTGSESYDPAKKEIAMSFSLDHDVDDIEIRMYVDATATLGVTSYIIGLQK